MPRHSVRVSFLPAAPGTPADFRLTAVVSGSPMLDPGGANARTLACWFGEEVIAQPELIPREGGGPLAEVRFYPMGREGLRIGQKVEPMTSDDFDRHPVFAEVFTEFGHKIGAVVPADAGERDLLDVMRELWRGWTTPDPVGRADDPRIAAWFKYVDPETGGWRALWCWGYRTDPMTVGLPTSLCDNPACAGLFLHRGLTTRQGPRCPLCTRGRALVPAPAPALPPPIRPSNVPWRRWGPAIAAVALIVSLGGLAMWGRRDRTEPGPDPNPSPTIPDVTSKSAPTAPPAVSRAAGDDPASIAVLGDVGGEETPPGMVVARTDRPRPESSGAGANQQSRRPVAPGMPPVAWPPEAVDRPPAANFGPAPVVQPSGRRSPLAGPDARPGLAPSEARPTEPRRTSQPPPSGPAATPAEPARSATALAAPDPDGPRSARPETAADRPNLTTSGGVRPIGKSAEVSRSDPAPGPAGSRIATAPAVPTRPGNDPGVVPPATPEPRVAARADPKGGITPTPHADPGATGPAPRAGSSAGPGPAMVPPPPAPNPIDALTVTPTTALRQPGGKYRISFRLEGPSPPDAEYRLVDPAQPGLDRPWLRPPRSGDGSIRADLESPSFDRISGDQAPLFSVEMRAPGGIAGSRTVETELDETIRVRLKPHSPPRAVGRPAARPN